VDHGRGAYAAAWRLIEWFLGQPADAGQVALCGPQGVFGNPSSATVLLEAGPTAFDPRSPIDAVDGDNGQVKLMVRGDLLSWIRSWLDLDAESDLSRDRLGRVIASADLIEAHSDPVIDRALSHLRAQVVTATRGRRPDYWWIGRWPDERPFAVVPTHDMDKVYEREPANLVHNAIAIARPGHDGLRPATRAQAARRWWRSVAHPVRNDARVRAMLECERTRGVRSTVFVHVDRRLHRYGARYGVDDRRVRSDLQAMIEEGVELALHTGVSYRTDPQGVMAAVRALGRTTGVAPSGARSHYLCFEPALYTALETAGIRWDSTIGYTTGSGFRAGTSQPYLLGDDGVLEIPMIAMDVALVPDLDRALATLERLSDRVRDVAGVFTLNWHTNMFGLPEFDRVVEPYAQALDRCREHGAWFATGSEVAAWYDAVRSIAVERTSSGLAVKRRDGIHLDATVHRSSGAAQRLSPHAPVMLATGSPS